MAHPVSRETPQSKCLYLWLSTSLVLACLFHISSGTERVFKAVKEMVTLSCGYQISLDELPRSRIYWQKNNQMVLSIISGDTKVWPEYKNRTFCDITNNLSLVILMLHLSDEGTYTCVVQKKIDQSYRREHLYSMALSLRADFPTPSITESGEPSPDIKRITCSASGGFPKPRLSWLENGEDIKAFNTAISQDQETMMYNITSQLDFNMTIDYSFTCSIQYGDYFVSQNFTWRAPNKELPDKQFSWGVYIGLWIAALLIGVGVPRSIAAVRLVCRMKIIYAKANQKMSI
ncbi:T-lymphocyte activation antigen CD80 [Perognathus longimembris pacificus]|uniref:T-lymphocyte activation antigen CD80 n=1 Tax=Perognathus longimembris pacificus TaxID=214514 RepID=UPI00201984B7|nr:T-lymphocyte activation antigen CD80 [Perognathus longimembris pacificus]